MGVKTRACSLSILVTRQVMVDFQKRRIEYTDLGHQALRENQTRPCREANLYSGRHHNTPILFPCLQRHFYRVTDCAVIINKSPDHLASRRISR